MIASERPAPATGTGLSENRVAAKPPALAVESRGDADGSALFAAAPGSLKAAALALACADWRVFPLRGKVPLFRAAHPAGDPQHGRCDGGCGRIGHGVLDATSNPETVAAWWDEHPAANIGGRVPERAVVVDVDPRNGGAESMTALVRRFGPLPPTLTIMSGRGDGGRHYYFRRPGGPLSAVRLGAGVDLKTSSGYCVLPPSIHPDSGRPYVVQDGTRRPAAMPGWLADLLAPPRPVVSCAALAAGAASGVGPLVAWVSRLPEGGRNDGLFWAVNRALERGATAGDLEQLVAAGMAVGLTETEARRTVQSACRRARVAA